MTTTTTTTTEPMTDAKLAKMRERIHLLLNKAENTPYAEEAQTFQEHAERLMVRYGIGKAEVDEAAGKAGKPQEPIVELSFRIKNNYRAGQVRGFSQIGLAFPAVTLLQSTHRNVSTLFVIGAESDAKQVIQLFESLAVQITAATTAWWATAEKDHLYSESMRRMERRTFQLGFLNRVASRIAAIYAEEVHESGTGTELVLASRKGRVDAAVGEMYPDVRPAKDSKLSHGSVDAARAGRAAGDRADVGQGSVNKAAAGAIG